MWLVVFAVAGCGKRPTSVGNDDGSSTEQDSQSSDSSVCVRPAGTCVNNGDCKPGMICVPEVDVTCRRDTCCGASTAAAGRVEGPAFCDPADPTCGTAEPTGCRCLGTCEADPQTCVWNADCSAEQYCRFSGGTCGRGGWRGSCVDRPPECPELGNGEAPPDSDGDRAPEPPPSMVCGCDGKTYFSTCAAALVGVSVDHAGPCELPADPQCDQVTCVVRNDCCDCVADATQPILPCPTTCATSVCEQRGIFMPMAYCLAGHCLLTDRALTCVSDVECRVVDDCCYCAAVHVDYESKAGCEADCGLPRCATLGLDGMIARCIEGACRMVRP